MKRRYKYELTLNLGVFIKFEYTDWWRYQSNRLLYRDPINHRFVRSRCYHNFLDEQHHSSRSSQCTYPVMSVAASAWNGTGGDRKRPICTGYHPDAQRAVTDCFGVTRRLRYTIVRFGCAHLCLQTRAAAEHVRIHIGNIAMIWRRLAT